jgi:DNA-binding protein HU-beta
VTKAEIITKIAQKTGLDKGDVSASLEAFFKVVKNSMSEGDNIYIRGFGSFIIKKRARKVARIISRNKPIIIEEHFIPSFKPAKVFAARIKENTTQLAATADKRAAQKDSAD